MSHRMKYAPRRNPLGYEQAVFSRRDRALQTWTPARPVIPVRRPSAAKREQAASDLRLQKELRAYDKLDEINRRHEERQAAAERATEREAWLSDFGPLGERPGRE